MANQMDLEKVEEIIASEEKTKKKISKIWYFILCGICWVIGIVMLIIANKFVSGKTATVLESLGWNFFASGIISFLFSIELKFSTNKNREKLMMQELKEVFYKELNDEESVLCRYAHEDKLKKTVSELLSRTPKKGELNIDVMGVSLMRFYSEQLEPYIELFNQNADHKVLGNPNCNIRMIVQKADDRMLEIISVAEGKNKEVLKRRIETIIQKVRELKELLSKKKEHANIELKLNDDCPAQTITRINDKIYPQVRPVKRMADKEGSKPFFNCYDRDREKEQFDYMLDYFDAVWDDSEYVQPKDTE